MPAAMSHSSRTRFQRRLSATPVPVDEVALPLARDLRSAADRGVPIRMCDGGLLDAEQAEVHRTLCRHVAIRTGLAEIPVSLKKTEQSVLADVHPVLPEHLRELANQARAVGRGYGIREPRFRLQFHDARLLFGDALLLCLHGALADHHGLREDGHVIIRVSGGNVAAGFADLGKHLMRHPALEFLRLRLPRAHDELVQAWLRDDERRTTWLIPNLRIAEVCDFVIIKSFTEMICVNAEDVTRVLGDEPRLPRLIGQGAQCRALEIESLDFVVHWILLRIVFMTDWFSQHGIEFAAFVLTLVVTVVGWVVEHKSSKERNKDREEDIKLLREQLEASNATVSTLRDQVRALESQADALQRQATIQEDEASVPEWELRQVQNLRHSVANNNPFDAKDVRVELSDGNKYELGDISRGSESSFLFLERGLEVGTNDDVRITWALPGDPSHRFSMTKPVPPYRQS